MSLFEDALTARPTKRSPREEGGQNYGGLGKNRPGVVKGVFHVCVSFGGSFND